MKTKLLTLLSIVLWSTITFAQAPKWSWATTAGGSGNDDVISSANDISGNLYVLGAYQSSSINFGDTTLYNFPTRSKVFLIKYSPTGQLIFAKKIDGPVYRGKMIIDKHNNIYVGAEYSETVILGNDTITDNFSGDCSNLVVFKMDSLGNVLWDKGFGSSSCDDCLGLGLDKSGNIYMGGTFAGDTLIFNHDTLIKTGIAGSRDVYLAKIDSNGTVVWARSVKGNDDETGGELSIDTTGNIYTCGQFSSYSINIGGTILYNSGDVDIFFTKYAPDGNLIWAKRITGPSSLVLVPRITTDSHNNFYINGVSNTNLINFAGTNVSNPVGSWNIFVAKFNQNGAYIWSKFFTSSFYKIPQNITVDETDNTYMTGCYFGNITIGGNTFNIDSSHQMDAFITKLDPSGNIMWAKSFGGNGNEYPQQISVNSLGNIFITGNTESDSISFANFHFACEGYDDVFIACMLGSNIHSNGPLCEGDELDLFASTIPSATYSWTGPNGFISSDQNPIIGNSTVSSSGAYAIHVVAPGVQDFIDTTYVNVYAIPPAPVAGNEGPGCLGSSVTISATTIPGAVYYWSGPGGFSTIGQNPSIVPDLSGTYVVYDAVNGCSSQKDSTYVTMYPIPSAPHVYSNNPVCIGTVISLHADSVNGGSFNWTGPGGYISSIQNPVASDSATQSMSDYYYADVTVNGCTSLFDSVSVFIKPPQPNPEICIVSIDSTAGHNMVVWDKPVSNALTGYKIYREGSILNQYDLIGSVPYDSLSVFIDTISNPAQQAYSYKLSAVDTCGVETALSSEHKTIHLTINQGMGTTYNLIWNNYEGFTVPSFTIYRGITPNVLYTLTTLSSSFNSFTDLTPPAGYVYYQVEVVNPGTCSPSKSYNYSSSRSNIATNEVVTGITDFESEGISIYPNPASNILTIETPIQSIIEISNIEGQLIKTFATTTAKTNLVISEFSNGVYTVEVKTEKGVAVKRFVKE